MEEKLIKIITILGGEPELIDGALKINVFDLNDAIFNLKMFIADPEPFDDPEEIGNELQELMISAEQLESLLLGIQMHITDVQNGDTVMPSQDSIDAAAEAVYQRFFWYGYRSINIKSNINN